ARENAVQMTANKDYGIVIADLYKLCLKSRGWNRAQQLEPVPAGWFRGIEEDGPMKLEPAAGPQPATPRSDLPGIPAATAAELVGTWNGRRPITFALIVSGGALQASGIAANNTIDRLSFQKR